MDKCKNTENRKLIVHKQLAQYFLRLIFRFALYKK